MNSAAKLVRVDVAFLYQLAGMTVDNETPADLQARAFSAYETAHRAVAAEYHKLPSARGASGVAAYRLEAVAGLAEPRDGARVFALWFSSTKDFSRNELVDLTALCGRCIFVATNDRGISTSFAGVRQRRQFETIEWDEIM